MKIDATTQQAGKVEIKGGGLEINGLVLTADENEIRGLVMNGFVGDNSVCIRLGGKNSLVAGNFLGTNTAGTASVATSYGLSIFNSNDNQIGGGDAGSANVFGSELGIGVRGNNNKIEGNRIGVGVNNSLLDCEFGVAFLSGNENRIGGAGNLKNYIAASANEVSVQPEAAIAGLTITGNRIGLDGTGTLAHGGRDGLSILVVATAANPLGGLKIENNKIAGGSPEIWLAGGGVTGASITNNQIGLAFDSPLTLPGFVGVENRNMGIRLDNSSNTTISGNTVVGHLFNVLVSGENQYTRVGNDFEVSMPGSELDPPPPGGPSTNTLIENNSIGLSANQKPAGVVQEFGVTVFGKARTVTLRNNTIAGHSDMEVRLKNGESHLLVANLIGTATGTNYGSNHGIVITDANQVTIGSDGAESPNVIGQNGGVGIRIQGAAQGTRILNNHIGTNAAATQAWANGAGVSLESIADDDPGGTEIRGNVIAGNTFQGIYVRTGGVTSILNNFIGRSLAGLPLPNTIGIVVAEGETSITGNQIAYNSEKGIRIETSDPVTVSKGGIYSNGDSMARDGIKFEGVSPSVSPPNGLVIFRSAVANDNGKHTIWIGLRSRSGGGSMILEIFGNPQTEEEEPQGKVFLMQKSIDTSKPYTDQIEVDATSSFMTTESFTATHCHPDQGQVHQRILDPPRGIFCHPCNDHLPDCSELDLDLSWPLETVHLERGTSTLRTMDQDDRGRIDASHGRRPKAL